MIEALDTLLKDLMNTKALFGGKVLVLGGDFRQTLPVVCSGKKRGLYKYTPVFGIILKNCAYLKTYVRKKIQHFVHI